MTYAEVGLKRLWWDLDFHLRESLWSLGQILNLRAACYAPFSAASLRSLRCKSLYDLAQTEPDKGCACQAVTGFQCLPMQPVNLVGGRRREVVIGSSLGVHPWIVNNANLEMLSWALRRPTPAGSLTQSHSA
tara:strand:+ start:656 stop:1051 length:396 start_codon:yes stop_codon:yes gene_type:complete